MQSHVVTRNSCNGKTSYLFHSDAQRAMSETSRRESHRQIKGFRLEVYPCHDCQGWHLGNAALQLRQMPEHRFQDLTPFMEAC